MGTIAWVVGVSYLWSSVIFIRRWKWSEISFTKKLELVVILIGALLILVAIFLTYWKLKRIWDYYWSSFKCLYCKKRYDDRWQSEWGVCLYCKNKGTSRVEVKKPKAEKQTIHLFTCPQCQLVFQTNMRSESGKCNLCNENNYE